MLAGRLALQWGIVDVRAWLRSLPRGALNFWEAFDAVEPIGEQWRQTAMLAWMSSLDKFQDPRDIDDFMPPRFRRKKRRIEMPNGDETKQQFEKLTSLFGFQGSNGNNDQRG